MLRPQSLPDMTGKQTMPIMLYLFKMPTVAAIIWGSEDASREHGRLSGQNLFAMQRYSAKVESV